MNKPVEHSLTLTLPISGESLGRWLEENSATISIACMVGTYHVHINRHRLESNVERGGLSVTRSSDVEVATYDKTLEAALGAAMRKCSEEPHADG